MISEISYLVQNLPGLILKESARIPKHISVALGACALIYLWGNHPHIESSIKNCYDDYLKPVISKVSQLFSYYFPSSHKSSSQTDGNTNQTSSELDSDRLKRDEQISRITVPPESTTVPFESTQDSTQFFWETMLNDPWKSKVDMILHFYTEVSIDHPCSFKNYFPNIANGFIEIYPHKGKWAPGTEDKIRSNILQQLERFHTPPASHPPVLNDIEIGYTDQDITFNFKLGDHIPTSITDNDIQVEVKSYHHLPSGKSFLTLDTNGNGSCALHAFFGKPNRFEQYHCDTIENPTYTKDLRKQITNKILEERDKGTLFTTFPEIRNILEDYFKGFEYAPRRLQDNPRFKSLREELYKPGEDNADSFETFVNNPSIIQAYCDYLALEGSYFGTDELILIAKVFDLRIDLYQPPWGFDTQGSLEHTVINEEGSVRKALYYNGINHFEKVIFIDA